MAPIARRPAAAAPASSHAEPAARAAAPPRIAGAGSCPAAETVAAAVIALVPRGGLEALPEAAQIDVADLGETYRVSVLAGGTTHVRVYRDLARDCEQRARFGAVFIVLTLMPPELLLEAPLKVEPEPPRPPAVPPPPPAAPLPAEPPPRRARLELAAVLDGAPAVLDSPGILSPGGELRLSVGLGPLAGMIAVGWQPRADFTVGGVEGREMRVPIDVGVRAERASGRLSVGGELGVAAALFEARGLGLAMPESGTRLDLGGRVGLTLRWGARRARVAPVLGVHALYFPRPYQLATTPGGELGHTPSLWLGSTLGAAIGF